MRSSGLMKIGDFSRLGQVSVRTLRLYDEMGLLKPVQVDQFSDYRKYSVDQLARLNRILVLKDMGLSLEEINDLLKRDLPPEQVRALLDEKRLALSREMDALNARLSRISSRLSQLDRDGSLPAYEIGLKSVEEATIVGCCQTVPHVSQMGEYRSALYEKLYRGMDRAGLKPGEVEFALYHNNEYTETDIDMEAASLLENAPRKLQGGDLAVRTLAAASQVVWTVHHGPFPKVVDAIQALFFWIGENGFESNGPIRELHHHFRERDYYLQHTDEVVVTLEVQVPVREANTTSG